MDEEDVDEIDDVVTDDEVDVPAFEARVPAEWQAKMAAKVLKTATPMPPSELLQLCATMIEGCVATDAAKPTTLPTHVWETLSAQHGGSHKLAEQALSRVIAVVLEGAF